MVNRICLAAAAATALTTFRAPVTLAQSVSYDFTVDITTGPLSGEQYTGITSIELTDLLNDAAESIEPVAISFNFGETEFTDIDDVRDVDANSPKANFADGDFLGITYIVSRFGENPTDLPLIGNTAVDGFAIDNSDFGYAVGENLYRGIVSYDVSPESQDLDEQAVPDVQAVPEPSLWLGLVAAGWLARRRR